MKMPIGGKEVKDRVERGGEWWSNVEGLQDLRESGHMVGKIRLILFKQQRAKIPTLRKAVSEGWGVEMMA